MLENAQDTLPQCFRLAVFLKISHPAVSLQDLLKEVCYFRANFLDKNHMRTPTIATCFQCSTSRLVLIYPPAVRGSIPDERHRHSCNSSCIPTATCVAFSVATLLRRSRQLCRSLVCSFKESGGTRRGRRATVEGARELPPNRSRATSQTEYLPSTVCA